MARKYAKTSGEVSDLTALCETSVVVARALHLLHEIVDSPEPISTAELATGGESRQQVKDSLSVISNLGYIQPVGRPSKWRATAFGRDASRRSRPGKGER